MPMVHLEPFPPPISSSSVALPTCWTNYWTLVVYPKSILLHVSSLLVPVLPINRPLPTASLAAWHDHQPSHLSEYEKDCTIEDLPMESPLMADYFSSSRHLAVPRHGHKGTQDSPPPEDCSSPTDLLIAESLPPSATPVSPLRTQASISLRSTPISPTSSSPNTGSVAPPPTTPIAGSVSPPPTTLIARSVTLSYPSPITRFIAPSPMPAVTGSCPPSPMILITGSVAPSPATLIAGSVVPAHMTPITQLDPPGPTAPVVVPCAMSSFQLNASLPPFLLLANATPVPVAQTSSLSTLLPSHYPC
ncbi:hypothetical protein HOY80DRAFT_1040371 [Tuber brumale]|nr:hypothetical protein HOY80DRAFT_1040371 [Tuber brumale]